MTERPPQPSAPTLARTLFVPGPQPPLSHLGATLTRHVFGTVVRYSLYQLGLPMPDAAPVRILRLRVLLDAEPLRAVLAGEPAGAEVLGALLDPTGAGELAPAAGRVRAAAALHRARLATLGLRRGQAAPATPATEAASGSPGAATGGRGAAAGPGSADGARGTEASGQGVASNGRGAAWRSPGAGRSREELWNAVLAVVGGRMPYLCDAALGELVTTLARRRLRLKGRAVGAALGPVAWQIHHDRDGDLRALGPLDPYAASWAETGVTQDEARARARRARGETRLPGRSGRRGAFREAYRWVLSEVRPLLLDLGARARDEGIVNDPDDVFFLPFDLGAEFAGKRRPSWLEAAVATNRREHQALRREPEHADRIAGPPALAPLLDRSADWDTAPLLPVE